MTAEMVNATQLTAALYKAEVAVLSLPFSGGVVRRSRPSDSFLERIALLEQNVQAIHAQFDSFQPIRQRDADDLADYRSLRAGLRILLKD